MSLSLSTWELIFNLAYFGLALVVAALIIYLYRAMRPKFYGFLYWSLVLILAASFFFGLYTITLDGFFSIQGLDSEEVASRTRLSTNVRILAFVVPGVMLAIAANLITQFLNTPKPGGGNGERG